MHRHQVLRLGAVCPELFSGVTITWSRVASRTVITITPNLVQQTIARQHFTWMRGKQLQNFNSFASFSTGFAELKLEVLGSITAPRFERLPAAISVGCAIPAHPAQ